MSFDRLRELADLADSSPDVPSSSSPDAYYWCHECKAWGPAERENLSDCPTERQMYECEACGCVILCDECGQPWSDNHECERGNQP